LLQGGDVGAGGFLLRLHLRELRRHGVQLLLHGRQPRVLRAGALHGVELRAHLVQLALHSLQLRIVGRRGRRQRGRRGAAQQRGGEARTNPRGRAARD
jgi:hypothetical protein